MTERNPLIPSRYPKRASQETEAINSIVDEALFCTVSFVLDGKPYAIPTSVVRHDDRIYIHGSVGSHFLREVEKGIPVCITVMLADAIVVARSAFNHSVNYRSVVLFGTAEKIETFEAKLKAFELLTEKMVPGSWNYLRPAKESEVKKTTVLAFSLDQASAKSRLGMVGSEEDGDENLQIWSGIIPLETKRGTPVTDESSAGIPLPEHLRIS